jgi:hypothetical protein
VARIRTCSSRGALSSSVTRWPTLNDRDIRIQHCQIPMASLTDQRGSLEAIDLLRAQCANYLTPLTKPLTHWQLQRNWPVMVRRKGSPAEPDGRDEGCRLPWLRRRRGARTRAPPRSHLTSRARISVSRNLWWPPGVTTDPSRPSVAHRFTVLGFTPHIKAACPVVSNRSAPSAVICHAPPFPGREVRSHSRSLLYSSLVKPHGIANG